MMKAVVICPGRGTYNREELGYLRRHAGNPSMLSEFDDVRRLAGQEPLTDLDGAERFSVARHGRGSNAAALIYACTLSDFLAIDRSRIEIVAVTGNSMGWYSALGCGGGVSARNGFSMANLMGTRMEEAAIGGQIIYPVVGEDWQPAPARRRELLDTVARINARPGHHLQLSINLGGYLLVGGDEAGLAAFEAAVEPKDNRFPLRLLHHAAFHTSLQQPVAEQGQAEIPIDWFGQPTVPLIDGRGKIWWPHATDAAALRDYTLGAQVTEPYDFTRAIAVAAREFAPDLFIITGPGTTLGGAVAQSLIEAGWQGLVSRDGFRESQKELLRVAAMGMPDQRLFVA